jgi:hypothetical protein
MNIHLIKHQVKIVSINSVERFKLITAIFLIAIGLLLISQSFATAQDKGDFTVPLTTPGKRAKVKVHLI